MKCLHLCEKRDAFLLVSECWFGGSTSAFAYLCLLQVVVVNQLSLSLLISRERSGSKRKKLQ